jgi:hypothetical protein
MLACRLERGMRVVIPGRKGTEDGLVVANVKPGQFKSSLVISFDGGYCCDIHRSTDCHVCPVDNMCEACGRIDDLDYYDNEIYGHSGWMCGDCISTAEMEL